MYQQLSHSARTVLDNRPIYLSFGLAWLIGHGSFAVSHGPNPVLNLPGYVPTALLGVGLLAAMVITMVVSMRAQRGATGREAVVGNLLGASWVIGFAALFFLITAVGSTMDPDTAAALWPTGSGLVVGLLYLAGGAAYRDVLQYTLGAWLAVSSTAALFLDGASLYWALALAGGGSYLLAAAIEPRRIAAAAN
ncbi:ABC transporter permease [Nocardia sp. A7]|uniref:ABC transporter permease n=1 Tax=Nocardia sp. A7 TaxID=2789274 RepID=UPI00397D517C